MLLRTNILFENTKKPATPISKVADKNIIPSSLENKSLQSISSSSISERHKSDAQMRRGDVKKANKDTSSTLQHKNQKNYSKSQKQPSNKSIYSKALSLISKTIAPTKSKSVQISINTIPTSVVPSTPPNKFKKTVETTHLFEQFYHKHTYNYRKTYPSVSCTTDVTAFAVYDKGYNTASRIKGMVKDFHSESSNSKVITRDEHPSKTTRQPNNNASCPGITDELVLDSKVNHQFQVNSTPCFSSNASTSTATTTVASLSPNKNSGPSNKLDSRPKSKKYNINDGTTSPSETVATHYISFNFDNPKRNSSASQHILKEKRKVTPSVPVKIQEAESYNEEAEIHNEEEEKEEDEDEEENDDCDNNSIYSYFEMIQMLQENTDYYNLEEEIAVIEEEEEEEEYGQEEKVEEEEKKKIKEYETPEPATLESALSELKTGRLNILGTLAKANKKITKLMNNIYNDKKRIATVGFKFEDITKEEEEGNISSERAEELKLKKEEYQRRLEKYQKNQDEMKTQAMVQLTKTIGNMVTLISTERALVSMEREFFNAKKKSGIYKKMRSLFSFGRKN